jgi:hypothetical protein
MTRRRQPAALVLVLGLAGGTAGSGHADQSYRLELAADGQSVQLSGRIDFGITDALGELLSQASGVRTIRLESSGGHVPEARGLAVVIRAAGLDTATDGFCASACTVAFVSGRTRYLAAGGRLGFHSYRLRGAGLAALFLDPEAQLHQDLEAFRMRGVSEAFTARVAATPHEEMWFPSHEELLEARVVDVLGEPAMAAP